MRKTVDTLLRRLRLLIDRAVLTRVSYRGLIRVLQISPRAGQAFDGVEHIEPYGFTSHALAGAEAIVANLGGNSGRAIVLLINDRRHRIVIAESETAIYTANGELIHLKNDGSIHLKSSIKVFIETPLAELSQDLLVRGNVDCDGDVKAGLISLRHHRNSGVQPGSGNSGGAVV